MQDKWKLRLVGWVFVGAIVCSVGGCHAGYAIPQRADRTGPGGIYRHAHFDEHTTAAELRHELSYTDSGRALQRSLHVHGGWDLWRSLTSVEYQRQRTWVREREASTLVNAPNDPPETTGAAQVESVDVEARSASDVEVLHFKFDLSGFRPATDEEEWYFSLPFVLVFPKYTRGYLGVEWDYRLAAEFQKVCLLYTSPSPRD